MNKVEQILAGIVAAVITVLIAVAVLPQTVEGNKEDVVVLSDNNTVSLALPIFDGAAKDVELKLIELDKGLRRGKPIYLVLNSPGGSIEDGLKIIEVARGLGRPVHTISMFSASMSFIISQYLNTRYVLDSSTLMSHRATVGGIDGTVPGSANNRLNYMTTQILELSKHIADRAGVALPSYLRDIESEMWLTGQQAVEQHYADKLVRVKCDSTLIGDGEVQEVNNIFFSLKLQFAKCPLITYPKILKGDAEVVNMLINDKTAYIHKFGN